MTAVEGVLVLLAVEEELQHHPGGDHTQLHRAYRPRSSTGRRFRNGAGRSAPWTTSRCTDPAEAPPKRLTLKSCSSWRSGSVWCGRRTWARNRSGAGQGGAVEWESVVLSSLCGTRSTTGGTQAGSFYGLLKKHMATVDGVPLGTCHRAPTCGNVCTTSARTRTSPAHHARPNRSAASTRFRSAPPGRPTGAAPFPSAEAAPTEHPTLHPRAHVAAPCVT